VRLCKPSQNGGFAANHGFPVAQRGKSRFNMGSSSWQELLFLAFVLGYFTGIVWNDWYPTSVAIVEAGSKRATYCAILTRQDGVRDEKLERGLAGRRQLA